MVSSQPRTVIELLNKDNYDTWSIQAQALLIKTNNWQYVNGEISKPELKDGTEADASLAAIQEWEKSDEKARADLILAIAPSELKLIKTCQTSHAIWKKLKDVYQSEGATRKATLLKSLIQTRMEENGNVRDHLNKLFELNDKLADLDIKVDDNLLTVIILQSLPKRFETFRIAMESRDDLPTPENLRIKIMDEGEARENAGSGTSNGAFFASQSGSNRGFYPRDPNRSGGPNNGKKPPFQKKKRPQPQQQRDTRITCYNCGKSGHRAADCYSGKQKKNYVSLLTETNLSSTPESSANKFWIIDSGSSSHLTPDKKIFEKINPTTECSLRMADKSTTEITGIGTAKITTIINGEQTDISANETMYCPELRNNLLSVSKMCDKGFTVTFSRDEAIIKNSDGLMLKGERTGNLYTLKGVQEDPTAAVASQSLDSKSTADIMRWHDRLGHLNFMDLVKAIKNNTLTGVNISGKIDVKDLVCDTCAKGKLKAAPFPHRSEKATQKLACLHSDVCGPFPVESLGKNLYFVTFIDEYSRYATVKLIKHKSEVFKVFVEVKNFLEKQTGCKVKVLQTDGGTEYNSTGESNYWGFKFPDKFKNI